MIKVGIYDNILGGPNSRIYQQDIFDKEIKRYARKLKRIDKIKKLLLHLQHKNKDMGFIFGLLVGYLLWGGKK